MSAAERSLIRALETAGIRKLNIAISQDVPIGARLWDVLDRVEVERWERVPSARLRDLSAERAHLEVQEIKYEHKVGKLRNELGEVGFTRLVKHLTWLTARTIPSAPAIEGRFFSVSCRPNSYVVTRVTVGTTEVHTVLIDEYGMLLTAHVAASPIEEATGARLGSMRWARAITLGVAGVRLHHGGHEDYVRTGHRYPSGGDDQTAVDFQTFETCVQWLRHDAALLAARKLNLRLLTTTSALSRGTHCPQLLDYAPR